MTKAYESVSILVFLSSIWFALSVGTVPLSAKIQDEIIPVLPLWALVSFGAYLLFRLGWGIATFNDVPEAYRELAKEIEQAKVELRQKGVDVD